jgi:hypothetical protein
MNTYRRNNPFYIEVNFLSTLFMRAVKNYFTLSRLHTCLPQAGISKNDYTDFSLNSSMFLICVISDFWVFS